MMDTLIILLHVMKPWLSFVAFIYLCIKMTGWAKNRKAGAIAFGLFFQMILPDPCAQSTIEAVVERKQEVKKQQAGDDEPLEPRKDSDVGDKNHDQ
tara:strand:- start:299 stop:586 length:288 start_codon:yes stop_codon:yes gene_type:complete